MSGAPAPPPRAGALLTPLAVGAHQMPNRIAFGAHVTNFGRHGRFTPRHAAYYRARAAGGAGLLVAEALTVHPLDWPYEHVPKGHEPGIADSLQELAAGLREAVAEAGLPPPLLLAQLNHWGGQTSGRLLRQSPWAPSPVPDVASKKMSRAMEPAQIAEVVAGFGETAGRVAAAGWDGVELNAGQHALLRQFLSPLTNFRDDEYGGPLENRLRVPLETLAAVRAALGPDRVLGLKLCGDELAPWGGLTPDDAAEIARALLAAGGIDYLSVQIGGPYSAHVTHAGMPMPQGHAAHLAQQIREAIDGRVPVFAEGRIESIAVAAGILEAGQADGVVMTRALISDPDLPRKAAGADPRPVRPHVGMNRYFVVQGDWNRPLSDLANPRAGRERELPAGDAIAGSARERVLIVGGGPAGCEAAIALAAQGHAVHLVEAAPELGGLAARLAERIPARAEFRALVDFYRAELNRLGVRAEPGRPIAGDDDLGDCDRILLATGARAPAADDPEARPARVSPRWLLTHPDPAAALPGPDAGRAVVVDSELGFRMGNAVEWLLAAGYGLDVIAEDFFVGRELVESAELSWFNRVAEGGAVFHPRHRFLRAEGSAVEAEERFSGAPLRIEPVSVVVTVEPELPHDGLLAALRVRHPRVEAIGDARAPRLMGEATAHAHRIALLGR